MKRPPRRAGYFECQRLTFRNWDGTDTREAFWRTDTLVELTRPDLREVATQYGPVGTRYRRVTAADAHRWVRSGRTHDTGLYIDHDNRVRYAEGEYVD